MNIETTKEKIRRSFVGIEYPGDWCLIDSLEGSEPLEVEERFAGKSDWRTLGHQFLDGCSVALSFFSDEAFRFYLPAYLIADLDQLLEDVEPHWHLCCHLGVKSRHEKVNPRRYGERTWWDHAIHKYAVFNRDQAAAIVDYLLIVKARGGDETMIEQALMNYWLDRAGLPQDYPTTSCN